MLQKQNVKEKNKKRLYGFERRQIYHVLIKAWLDYYNPSNEQEPDKKRILHHECIIRNLERKLRLHITKFSTLKMVAFALFHIFKEGVTKTLVKNRMGKTIAIAESKLPLDERPNTVQEIIRRDLAMQKYISETKIPSKSDLSTHEDKSSCKIIHNVMLFFSLTMFLPILLFNP
jgi:hypothetical protein